MQIHTTTSIIIKLKYKIRKAQAKRLWYKELDDKRPKNEDRLFDKNVLKMDEKIKNLKAEREFYMGLLKLQDSDD